MTRSPGTVPDSARPPWDDPEARAFAFTTNGSGPGPDLHVMMNMYWEPLEFELPSRQWVRAIDTALPPPSDIVEPGAEPAVDGATYVVSPRSIAVLLSRS